MKLTKFLGYLGLLASVLVGVGEYYLHYSDFVIEFAENYEFLKFVSLENLKTGHFLAVFGLPFYFAGYIHIYRMLHTGNKFLAQLVLALGLISFSVGGIWVGSRAFLGTIVHLQDQITPTVYQEILDSYTHHLEILVIILRAVIALLSTVFVIAILKGGTLYKKWMAFFNPITILLALFLTLQIPSVGKHIVPILMNVTHFILFSVSLYQLHLYTKNHD